MVGIVTYSQNFEDVMLWRALQGVGPGFYIDVGAADPDEDSVTRAFYDRGWRGVNVEPSPDLFEALVAVRTRDLNLRCVVGAGPGEMEFYNIPDTGLSTVRADLANRHAAAGHIPRIMGLPTRTLADICAEHAPPDIHFLKIDVEGAEKDVLRGADFRSYRPWIVVVEATEPGSQTENWHGWDPLLVEAGYEFVWFDGLNRFYVAAERPDLRPAFRTPPNVFDGWIRPRGRQQIEILDRARAADRLRDEAEGEAEAARSALRSEQGEAAAARTDAQLFKHDAIAVRADAAALRAALIAVEHDAAARLDAAERAREHADARTTALLASTSWRVTAPLRRASTLLVADARRRERLRRVAAPDGQASGVKGYARIAWYGLGRAASRVPGSRAAAQAIRGALPGPYGWLHARYAVYRHAADPPPPAGPAAAPVAIVDPPAPAKAPPIMAQPSRQDIPTQQQAMLLRLRPLGQAA